MLIEKVPERALFLQFHLADEEHKSAGIGVGDYQWQCVCGFHTWNYLEFVNHLKKYAKSVIKDESEKS